MGSIIRFPGTERAWFVQRLRLLTQVLINVFENHPVIAVAAGITAGTKVLRSGHDVLAALDVAIDAIFKWESRRGWPNGGAR